MGKFFVSLSGINLDRNEFRDWKCLAQSPDWVLRSKHLDKLQTFLERIPPLERDILELYFFAVPVKREAQIARMLGLSQQAVSHRMYAAFRRITFMASQPDVEKSRMQRDLTTLIGNPRTVDVLCDWAETSSQVATAQQLHLPLQRIGVHVKLGIKLLQQSTSTIGVFYAEYFGRLLQNRNIFREVLAGPRRKIDASVIEAERYSTVTPVAGVRAREIARTPAARTRPARQAAGAA